MTESVGIVILLMFLISFLALLSTRYKFPFPIVLLVVGISASFIPGLPLIVLAPDVIFLIFLPPLLYAAAWFTSWHDFKANKRPIGLAAFGLVFFTTGIIGLLAHYMIPGLSWAHSFLLGAIISPPDAVAATTITRNLGLNPRIVTILEGESLINDASGLIAYKYALGAIMSGTFAIWDAGLQFFIVVIGGVLIGLVIGFVLYLIHKKWVNDPTVEVTLTFLTPFTSYLLAEYFHVSGVLAVVTTGLYLSFRSSEIFTTRSRIRAYAVWEVVTFILNGLIFILLGLQLRYVMSEIRDYSLLRLLYYGIAIGFAALLVRFFWTVPAAILPRVLSKRIRETETFDRRNILVFTWAGMRGVVSMAASLAIPLLLPDGTAFPHRSLIIFLTFAVIVFTVLGQGLTLPWLIRKLKLPRYSILAEEYEVRMQILSRAISHIEENLSLIDGEMLARLKSKYELRFNRLQKTDLPANYFGEEKPKTPEQIFNEFVELQIQLIRVERDMLNQLHKQGKAKLEVIRKIERELDLEEERLSLELFEG